MFSRILLILGILLILLGGAGLLYSLTRQFPRKTDSFEVTNNLPQTTATLRASPARVASRGAPAERRESIATPLNRQPKGITLLHHSSPHRLVPVAEPKAPLPGPVSLDTDTSTQSTEPLVQTPSPTPPISEPKHRNPVSRFFHWLFGLFHRKHKPPPPPNQLPVVSVSSSSASITLPCPPGTSSENCPNTPPEVEVTAIGSDPDGDSLVYTWMVDGGNRSADAASITWVFSAPGTYRATVTVDDGHGHTATNYTTVTVVACPDCKAPPPPCPNVSVSCPADVEQGSPITFTASISGDANITYSWSVSAGTISGGQGTSSITVNTDGLSGQSVTATVELGGSDPNCSRTASCTISIMGAIPSPSPTPTPQPTPTPTGIGDANANSNSAYYPSPSPAPTATPSASASPSPTVREVDKVELNYPIKLPVGWSERVTVHFVRTSETTFVPVVEKDGRVISTDTPPPIPYATPGSYRQAWGPEYATFATVELKAINLAVQPVSQARQSLDPAKVEWEWQISGKKEFLGEQTLHLSINVEGQKRDNTNVKIVLDNPTVMAKNFSIEVAESWFTRTQATISSIISLFAGAGVTVPWIYDRWRGRSKPKAKKKAKKKT